MTPLYTQEQFNQSNSVDKLPLKCKECDITFYQTKHNIQRALNPNNHATYDFCSLICIGKHKTKTKNEICLCSNCNKPIEKQSNQIKRTKNHFCSLSCSATYNNKNKTTGNRRSKLEIWLESQLPALYPNLEFNFNRKDAIGSELDIYIPTLRLAFELNGIFHCEPVFGQNKLDQIKANDNAKFNDCYNNNITLCMIDTSKQKYFKESTSKEFMDIIIYHINYITLIKNLANPPNWVVDNNHRVEVS